MIDAGYRVVVVGTKPAVPIEGMEKSLGQTVHWVDQDDRAVTLGKLGIATPRLVFQGGYHIPSITALGRDAQAAGAKAILMADNNWTGNVRQRFIDPLRHRIMLSNRFDGVFVPGAAGARWAKRMKYKGPIAMGMYGADPQIFSAGPPLSQRAKRLFFVGQFIKRKNVVDLSQAFGQIADQFPEWTLQICGGGEQQKDIVRHPAIFVDGFIQPADLSKNLQNARALVLPSLKEHWGLVVHEAALSGMALALSDVVGAAEDLARPENAVLFKPGDKEAMKTALAKLMAWNDHQWSGAEASSLELARGFGPKRFLQGVETLSQALTNSPEERAD